ncbi:hypothetical protein SCHPADRAFT_983228 [Schizopora paradoxa]|uniref:Uncharacterized protein n=1 Tax=Schizopora paradoxa TaxID=27342 RepID=A0A0H2R7C6_9AGAM|nr:hypothetical protein SCHPADRAFT_983228 [Schizopora paradoxa]
MYDREYHQVNEPTTLPIILALLEMSTKYDFQAIRREVIQHLSLYYTTHPESAPHMRLLVFAEDQDASKDANFRLLAAARRCNVRSILPMLFYVCSIEPLDTIFEQSNQLNPEDFKRLISGRETLITRIKNFGRTMLQPCMKCGNDLCFDTRARMHLRWINCEYTPNVFPLGAISGGIKGMGKSEEYPQLCRTCVDESSVRLHFFRTGFCGGLPRIFNLGNWGDLEDDDLETESESESP